MPKLAAGLSAYGGLLCDVRWEESATLHLTSRDFDAGRVSALLRGVRAKGDAFLKATGFAPEKRSFEFAPEPHAEPPLAANGDHAPAEPVAASAAAPIAPDVSPLF